MCILFFLPGSALPQSSFLDNVHFDKVVHIGLFAILIFLWSSAFQLRLPAGFWLVLLAAFAYGLSVEIIQGVWIPNRSFDLFDLAADMAGSGLGLLFWFWVYRKK
jgi:VanZ family protein